MWCIFHFHCSFCWILFSFPPSMILSRKWPALMPPRAPLQYGEQPQPETPGAKGDQQDCFATKSDKFILWLMSMLSCISLHEHLFFGFYLKLLTCNMQTEAQSNRFTMDFLLSFSTNVFVTLILASGLCDSRYITSIERVVKCAIFNLTYLSISG